MCLIVEHPHLTSGPLHLSFILNIHICILVWTNWAVCSITGLAHRVKVKAVDSDGELMKKELMTHDLLQCSQFSIILIFIISDGSGGRDEVRKNSRNRTTPRFYYSRSWTEGKICAFIFKTNTSVLPNNTVLNLSLSLYNETVATICSVCWRNSWRMPVCAVSSILESWTISVPVGKNLVCFQDSKPTYKVIM